MPIVPFAPQPPKGRALPKPIELSAAEEPWVLMAAAQMHSEGRLVHQVADKNDRAEYPIQIDDILDSYYKGSTTAAQTQSALKKEGWGANLRSPNSVQIWGPDGKVMWHP